MHDDGIAREWLLDPGIDFLNHGSFGACPVAVLAAQQRLRERLEREPVRFMLHDLDGMLAVARARLAEFLDAEADDLAFVENATTGVNTVVRSLTFRDGDEILVTDQAYAACRNALAAAAERQGAKLAVAKVPFPLGSPDEVAEAITGAVTDRTRLALVDHVTSPTGVVWPIERIVRALQGRGVDVLVDGAHAPGMVPLSVRNIGAAYYTGNCHKWLCAPKGAAFLHVRRDRQDRIRPLVISHGATSSRSDRSRFRAEFDWMGTRDVTGWLCIPDAIHHVGGRFPGGWPELMARNRAGALEARRILCDALGAAPACPDEMIGALAAVALPDGSDATAPTVLEIDPLENALYERFRIEVPVMDWPAPPRRWVRISCQAYNHRAQYERLAGALVELVGRAG